MGLGIHIYINVDHVNILYIDFRSRVSFPVALCAVVLCILLKGLQAQFLNVSDASPCDNGQHPRMNCISRLSHHIVLTSYHVPS